MGIDLPGIYYRPDRGWSPHVRALVGSQLYGDETMAGWALQGIDDDELPGVTMMLAGLVAVLLSTGPWGEHCETHDELRARWVQATALLVGEVETPPPGVYDHEDDGEGDDGS